MKDNKILGLKIVFILGLIFELFLAIPFLSWFTAFILTAGSLYVFEFILSVIALIVAAIAGRGFAGPIMGIFISFIGALPIVGWVLHLATAIVYFVSVISLSVENQRSYNKQEEEKNTEKIEKNTNNKDNIKDAEIVE